jgi:hypothetical protein
VVTEIDTHEWKAIGAMEDDFHGARTVLWDGKIVVVGGYLHISRKHDYYLEHVCHLQNEFTRKMH